MARISGTSHQWYQPVFNRPFIHARETRRGYFERPRVLWLLTLVPTGRVCSRGKLPAIYGPYHSVWKLATFTNSTLTGQPMHRGLQNTNLQEVCEYIFSILVIFDIFSLNYESSAKKIVCRKTKLFWSAF